jgi:hypothetical protein
MSCASSYNGAPSNNPMYERDGFRVIAFSRCFVISQYSIRAINRSFQRENAIA